MANIHFYLQSAYMLLFNKRKMYPLLIYKSIQSEYIFTLLAHYCKVKISQHNVYNNYASIYKVTAGMSTILQLNTILATLKPFVWLSNALNIIFLAR